jgi:uncharacterized protein YhjY with autotransporter beta-barrel domain
MGVPALLRRAVRIGVVQAALAALLGLLLVLGAAGSTAAAIGNTATTTFNYSIAFNPPTTTATSATVFATRVVGRLNGQIVFDQTVAAPFGDSAVTAALAQAEAAVVAAGGPGTVVGTAQKTADGTTNVTTNTSFYTLVNTSTTAPNVVETFGPATVHIGGFGGCDAAIASLPGPTRPVCDPAGAPVPFVVEAGFLNINTITDTTYTVDEAITAHTVTTVGETHEIAGTNLTGRPDPTTDASVTDLVNQQHDLIAAMARARLDSFAKRLGQLHGSGPAGSSVGVVVADAYVAGTASPGAAAIDMVLGPEGALPSALGLWADASVDFTDLAGPALDLTTGAATFGADYRFADWATLGAGAGLSRGGTAIGPNGQFTAADEVYGAVYGSLLPNENLFIDGVLGAGVINLNTARFVAMNSALAMGRRNGAQVFGSIAAGYDAEMGDMALSGYGRLEATFTRLAAFTETGGGPGGALSFGAEDLWSATALLGVRAAYSFRLEGGTLTPSVTLEYRHNSQTSSGSTITYADLPAVPFGLAGATGAGDSVLLGFDTEFAFDGGLTAALGGNLRIGANGAVSKGASFYIGGSF